MRGKVGGEKEHLLKLEELPEHYHTGLYVDGNEIGIYTPGAAGYGIQLVAGVTSSRFITGSKGNVGNQTHNNMQPYSAMHFIIKA